MVTSLKSLKNEQGIYIITHLSTGKKYVGKSINVKKRIVTEHLRRGGQDIQRALKEFPLEDFSIDVNYFPDATPQELNDIEYETIRNENALFPNGFNRICRGSIKIISNETKLKISNKLRGRRFSKQHRKSLKEAWKNRPEITEETRKKMSIAKLGKSFSLKARKNMSIAQKKVVRVSKSFTFINKNGEEFVGSILEFSEKFGYDKNSTNANFSQRNRYKGWVRNILH